MTRGDDWPRTGRALPWLLAVFLAMIWLVPSEAIELPIPLPIDAHPDRFLLLALIGASAVSALASRRLAPGSPAVGVSIALLGFAAVALLSLALNAETLASLGELAQGQKQFGLLLSFTAVFFVVATVVRRSELRSFGLLIVGLATLAAIGTIYEYRTDHNVFYDLAAKLFGGIATVSPPPEPTLDSRDESFGPTQHGLVIATMLTLSLPLAVLHLASARGARRKVVFALAAALIFAGAVSTQRKTSLIAPVAVLAVLAAYRPRQMLRLAPFGAVMLVAVHITAPAALGGVYHQLTDGFFDSGSTIARTSDYEAIGPDVATHPLLGRGFGTIDPTQSDTYRILDNQYLGWLVQIGFLGLAAYLALLATAMALAHRVARQAPDADGRDIGLAALAAFAALVIASALFDLTSFIQLPYLFSFLAGFCSVAVASVRTEPTRRRQEVATV